MSPLTMKLKHIPNADLNWLALYGFVLGTSLPIDARKHGKKTNISHEVMMSLNIC